MALMTTEGMDLLLPIQYVLLPLSGGQHIPDMKKASISVVTQGVLQKNVLLPKGKMFVGVYLDSYPYSSAVKSHRITFESHKKLGGFYQLFEESQIVVEQEGIEIFRGPRSLFMNCLRFGFEIHKQGRPFEKKP